MIDMENNDFSDEEVERMKTHSRDIECEIGIEISLLPIYAEKKDVYTRRLLIIIKIMDNYWLLRPKFISGYLIAVLGYLKESFNDIGREIREKDEEMIYENFLEVSRMFASN